MVLERPSSVNIVVFIEVVQVPYLDLGPLILPQKRLCSFPTWQPSPLSKVPAGGERSLFNSAPADLVVYIRICQGFVIN